MLNCIQAELFCAHWGHSVPVTIEKGNNLHLFTTVPRKSGKPLVLQPGAPMQISYYEQKGHYAFSVEFSDMSSDGFCCFLINQVTIEKNVRKHPRQLVETPALITDARAMYYGTLLDISHKGCKIETSVSLPKTSVTLHYQQEGSMIQTSAKVVWRQSKQGFYYYGLRFT